MKISCWLSGLFCILSLLSLDSCKKDDHAPRTGSWIIQAPFGGLARSGAVAFTLESNAYVGLGFGDSTYTNDFYIYSAQKGVWDTIAPFPGTPREQAVAFTLNDKGYVGTGFNRDSSLYLKDYWEYDPATYRWKRLNDFPGQGRAGAVAFSNLSSGYVVAGYNNNYLNDLWKYDPSTDSWQLEPSYRGLSRQGALSFTIGENAYLFGGENTGSALFDLWSYDMNSATWTNLTPLNSSSSYQNFISAVSRYDAVAFVIAGKGYVTTGSNGQLLNTTWQFDPSNNSVNAMAPFPQPSRSHAVGFVLTFNGATTGIVCTGLGVNGPLDDVISFSAP